MVGNSKAKGLALVSGSGRLWPYNRRLESGGTPRQKRRKKSSCSILCFGWGGLNSMMENAPAYEPLLESDEPETLAQTTTTGFDLLTCIPPGFSKSQ